MLIGIDSLDVERMGKFIKNERFLNKYFTPYAAVYVNQTNNKTMRLAGIYCAKEAFLKALGIGLNNGIALNEIEINHDENGRPFIKLSDSAKMVLMLKGHTKVDISITHTMEIANAVCIIY